MDSVIIKTYPFLPPLRVVDSLLLGKEKKEWALLHSAMRLDFTGRYSVLAFSPKNHFSSWQKIYEKPVSKEWAHVPWVIGYAGYEANLHLPPTMVTLPSSIQLPSWQFVEFNHVLVFDHDEQQVTLYSQLSQEAEAIDSTIRQINANKDEARSTAYQISPVAHVASNMSHDTYMAHIKQIQEHIYQGDYYQANLTRKFFGTHQTPVDAWQLYLALLEKNPAPYSAFLQLENGVSVISSSPEQFFAIDQQQRISCRPIKGSIARGQDAKHDQYQQHWLQQSEKNRAENLMITDLMRNDMSPFCDIGSVAVDKLFEVQTYPTVHHLVSTVTGQLKQHFTAREVLPGLMPPGSMTGAPKKMVVERLADIEAQPRGIYSGAIGWLAANGTAEFSVVIRTILVQGNHFELQIGGGIVADSDPNEEWQEIIAKGKMLASLLGVDIEDFSRS